MQYQHVNLLKLAEKVSKYCVGMEGNISAKTYNGFLIKASGSRLDSMTGDDLIEYNWNGEKISNTHKKGSMELDFHKFLLGFSGFNYIAHTHPVNTLKILCSKLGKDFSEKRLFPDQVVFNGKKSCLVPYITPGEYLAKSINKYYYEFIENEGFFPKLILLENHGIIACGGSIEECLTITEICEKSAEIFLGCQLSLYGTDEFTPYEIDRILHDKSEQYRKSLV